MHPLAIAGPVLIFRNIMKYEFFWFFIITVKVRDPPYIFFEQVFPLTYFSPIPLLNFHSDPCLLAF